MRSSAVLLAALLLAAAATAQPHRRAASPLDLDALPHPARAALDAAGDGDGRWDDRFGHPSIAYTAYAMVTAPNGDLYLGGSFRSIGGIPAHNVARWDGRRWHPLGDGIGGSAGAGYVYALALGPDGALYAGGYFTLAGTNRAHSIARWDPATQAWSALGDGLAMGSSTASVYALAFHGTALYAGGDFTSSGQTPLKKLARWNGTAWEDLGGGLGTLAYDGTFRDEGPYEVRALLARGADVFVGGQFDAVAEGRANSVARFDPAAGTFHRVGGGVGLGMQSEWRGRVMALAASATDVCVGGQFDRVGLLAGPHAPAQNVACWDGTAWNPLAGGLQASYGALVHGLAFSGGMLVATGNFDTAGGQQVRDLARWDGTAWEGVGGGLGHDGSAVAADGAGGFFVTGGFDTVGDDFGALRVARWAEGAWHALGQGVSYSTIGGRLRSLAVLGGRVYAAGGHSHAGGVPVNHVSAWDGTRWHPLGAGLGSSYEDAYALATGPDGALYAGGAFTKAGTVTANRIARWDPATQAWRTLGGGFNGRVEALAFAPNGDLYAGGEFTRAGNVDARYLARWDGQQWHSVGGGLDSYVHALAVAPDGRLFAGGWFDKAGGIPASRVAVWNGTTWSPLGEGLGRGFTNHVYALALDGDDVYVGGSFAETATTAAAGIARWSPGEGWRTLGTGLGGGEQHVYALLQHGRALYVGGDFETAGDEPAHSIARWDLDAQAWSALGSGVGGEYHEVRALAVMGTTLYVGGYFSTAGGAPASGFAAYALGAGTGQARLQLDPPQIHFGAQPVNTSADRLLSIGNAASATAPLTGTVALPGGTPFTLVEGGGAFSVEPGGVHEVVVRFAPVLAGTFTAAVTVQHGDGEQVEVPLTGTGAAQMNRVTLRHFDPAGPQQTLGTQAGGFVFGTNGYGDRAKGVAFTVPLGKAAQDALLTNVRVWFSYADPLPGEATYDLAVYAGTPQDGPEGAALFRQTYPVAGIRADDDLGTPSEATEHAISPPLSLAPGTSFFAVVDFSAYAGRTNLLAIASGEEVPQRVPEVWDQDKNGTWGNVSDLWKGGTAGWPLWVEAELATSTPAEGPEAPLALHLGGVSPNPVATATTVRYALAEAGPVALAVYDLTGRRVATLVSGVRPAGAHAVRLDGAGLASGTYFVRLEAGGRLLTRAFVVAR